MEKRTCKMCDGNYEGTWRSAYCSEACRRAWRRNQASEYRKTDQYQKWYRERVDSGGFAAANRKMRARRRVVEAMECIYCGVGFERTKGTSKVLCGAAACKAAYQLDSCHRRNARMRDATVEPFARVEVFERDNWMCGICGEEVSADAPPRSPMSASLDHIIPLARGGAHTRENTQCAHLVCNMRKSDSIDTWRVRA